MTDSGRKYSTLKPRKANWWLQSFTMTTGVLLEYMFSKAM